MLQSSRQNVESPKRKEKTKRFNVGKENPTKMYQDVSIQSNLGIF